MKNKELCNKMTKSGMMPEAGPCMREKGHGGPHTPDLIGMRFGTLLVIGRAPDLIYKNGNHASRWYVEGRNKPVRAACLTGGKSAGRQAEKGSGTGTKDKFGKNKPEYETSKNHIRWITDKNHSAHNRCKNMKLYSAWDPRINGLAVGPSAQLTMRWMQEKENNMRKPGPGYQLDVIKTKECPYGFFGPGGIQWVKKEDRHNTEALRVIFNWPEKEQIRFHEAELARLKIAARKGT